MKRLKKIYVIATAINFLVWMIIIFLFLAASCIIPTFCVLVGLISWNLGNFLFDEGFTWFRKSLAEAKNMKAKEMALKEFKNEHCNNQ
jgi:hypothetical protein